MWGSSVLLMLSLNLKVTRTSVWLWMPQKIKRVASKRVVVCAMSMCFPTVLLPLDRHSTWGLGLVAEGVNHFGLEEPLENWNGSWKWVTSRDNPFYVTPLNTSYFQYLRNSLGSFLFNHFMPDIMWTTLAPNVSLQYVFGQTGSDHLRDLWQFWEFALTC